MATYIAYSKNGCAFGVWIASKTLARCAEAYLRAKGVCIDYIHEAKDVIDENMDDEVVLRWFLKEFSCDSGVIK